MRKYFISYGGRGNLLAYLVNLCQVALAMFTGIWDTIFQLAGHKDEQDVYARRLFEEQQDHTKMLTVYDREQQFETSPAVIEVDNLTDMLNDALTVEGDSMNLYALAKTEGGVARELLEMFLSDKDCTAEPKNGYEQGGSRGCFYAQKAFECQLNKEKSLLKDIVNQVNQGMICRVGMTLSTVGAESKTHTPETINGLFDACVAEAEKRMSHNDAVQYTRDHLEIGVFLIGDGMGIPAGTKDSRVNTNLSEINAEVLSLLPSMDILDKLAAIYYIASPEVFIHAESHRTGGDQTTHPALMMLSGADAVNRFYEATSDELRDTWSANGIPKVQIPPLASMDPPERYSWDNIGFHPTLKNAILSRLCFGVCLLLAVAPNTTEVDQNCLTRSNFLREIYGDRRLKQICKDTGEKDKLLANLQLVIKRERRFLETILDICLTGSDFSNVNGITFDKTTLLNSRLLKSILDGEYKINDLSAFDLKELVEYTDSNGNSCSPHNSMNLAESVNAAQLTKHRLLGEKHCGDLNKAFRKLYDAVSIH